MRKKQKAAAADFTESGLPHNRTQVFFDIIKQRYDVIFKIGAVLFLFILPFLLVRLVGVMTVAALTEEGASSEELLAIRRTMTFIEIVPIAFFGFGLGGIMKVVRNLVWGEPIFFGKDFFSGLKQNRLIYVFVFLIAGVFIYLIGEIGALIPNEYIKALPGAIALVFLLPVGMYVLSASAVYKDGVFSLLKNSVKFYVRSAPVCLLFVIAFAGAFSVTFIELFIVRVAIIIVLIIALLPLFLICWTLYSHSIFDKMVNAALYPDYVDKGVYRIK